MRNDQFKLSCNITITGYEKSIANLAQVSLSTDMVFDDGADSETPTMTGSVADGYTATLTVGV